MAVQRTSPNVRQPQCGAEAAQQPLTHRPYLFAASPSSERSDQMQGVGSTLEGLGPNPSPGPG